MNRRHHARLSVLEERQPVAERDLSKLTDDELLAIVNAKNAPDILAAAAERLGVAPGYLAERIYVVPAEKGQ